MSIDCQRAGPGRVVMGVFHHSAGDVYDARLSDRSQLGVTGRHPVWSVDQEDWVSVGDLEPGETLETLHGIVQFESATPRVEAAPVFNPEVDADHAYRVGEHGVLVHNASATPSPCGGNPCEDALKTWTDKKLLDAVLDTHAQFPRFFDKIFRTTAFAIVQCGNECHLVVSVSSNRSTPAFLSRAAQYGFSEYWNGPAHAGLALRGMVIVAKWPVRMMAQWESWAGEEEYTFRPNLKNRAGVTS